MAFDQRLILPECTAIKRQRERSKKNGFKAVIINIFLWTNLSTSAWMWRVWQLLSDSAVPLSSVELIVSFTFITRISSFQPLLTTWKPDSCCNAVIIYGSRRLLCPKKLTAIKPTLTLGEHSSIIIYIKINLIYSSICTTWFLIQKWFNGSY